MEQNTGISRNSTLHRRALKIGVAVLVSVLLYLISRHDYLLFHAIAEVYSIVIAAGIFFVSWNTRKVADSKNLVFLGMVYLFVGAIDFFHMLSYKGMNIFTDYPFHANQLWVGARALESAGLLIFTLNSRSAKIYSPRIVLPILSVYTLLLMTSVFIWKNFPVCFVAGQGQTAFKIISEYVICAVLLGSLFLLRRKRASYDPLLYAQVSWSIIFTAAAEFCFTLYTDNYGITNVLGHLFKILSFYLIYRSIIVNTLQRPYDILYRELKVAKDSAEIANETKNKFFRIIAHDLKNPFFVIQGFASMLKDDCANCTQPDSRIAIDSISTAAASAYKLLENLLKWAQAQTRTISYQPRQFDLSERIREIVISQEGSAAFKGIAIVNHLDHAVSVFGDVDMLDTVIRNLVSNALKFTNRGGRVELSCEDREPFIQLNVADTGIGIPADKLEKLFRLETRHSQAGTAGESGTGLGLIICKEFVEWNKGTLSVHSQPQQGTTFSFTIPKSVKV